MLLSLCFCAAGPLAGSRSALDQSTPTTTTDPTGCAVGIASNAGPLPEVVALMKAVEAKQRAVEQQQQDFIYRSSVAETRTDAAGHPKRTETREYDIFWLGGVPVQKLIVKNGKPLSPDELKKEDTRIDKDVQKVRERRDRRDAAGKQTDPRGDEELSVSRMLASGSFANARRVICHGRDTIAVDYAGDPHAKTQNRAESAFRNLAGTVWVDEEDREVVALKGRFAHSFKIAGGLLADIKEGTSFSLQQNKMNGQVWLPVAAEANGSARLLLFSVHGGVQVRNSDFRRFRATSKILPGLITEGGARP